MRITRFEDLVAWQKSKVLTLDIYNQFKNCRDFGFRDQIQRAAVSVMNNIAEGFERRTNKELKNFFYIAKGSCGELRSMLHLAIELKYITKEQYNDYYLKSEEISKIISGFIKTIGA